MDPILIVGPGAVGGVLAARWALAGQKVAILGRTRQAEHRLLKDGLTYAGKDGKTRKITSGIVGARAARLGRCRAAYFCVKSSDTASAIQAARPFIGARTAVVSLQNGLGHEARLRRAFGRRRTVIGTAYFAADRPAPRNFTHNGGEDILLATQGSNAASLKETRRLLALAGWSVRVKRSEKRMLWTKLCFNAAVNGIGTLCAEPNGRLARDPALREIVQAVIREAATLSGRAGHPPLYRRMESLVVRGCRNTPLQRNSTLQDLQAGRRTEASAIFGPLLKAARKTDTPAPLITVVAASLRRLEQMRPR
jgi:2-dehydropantoate 2-reductase